MLRIQLEDSRRMEHVINHLVNDNDTMVEIQNALGGDEMYVEAQKLIKTIDDMMEEMPELSLMNDYRDAIRTASALEEEAAYLNGIKTGFSLAMYLIPGSRVWSYNAEHDGPDSAGQSSGRQEENRDGSCYRLPPLNAGEYALVRNLLSSCPRVLWDKRHNAELLLEKVKAGTERIFLQDGRPQPEPEQPRSTAARGKTKA